MACTMPASMPANTKNSEAKAAGAFYVVTLKIANHAKRVDYKPKRASAILIDDKGREFF